MESVDGIAQNLVELYRRIFDFDEVGPDEDFFQLGGDSLLATELMTGIQAAYGVALPVSDLLAAPTPRLLAPVVERALEDTPPACLVPVQAAGGGPTLYCIHGLSGDITAARPLSDAIGPQRPLKAFRATGLQSGEIPYSSVIEIASAYVSELIEDQPEGPYVVIGHCGGSIIAYEMAQQLLMQDREVAGLIMVDPAGRENNPWLVDSGMKKQIRASSFGAMARSRAAEAFDDPNLSGDQRRKLVEESLVGALGAYMPVPYPESALLICTTGTGPQLLDPQRGFPRLVKNMETVVFDTTHMALFSTEIKDVADAINSYLDRVAPL